MDELKTPEERNDPQKSSGWPFSKELTEAWGQLEERTRQRPGLHLLVALVVGYFLQLVPFRGLLMLILSPKPAGWLSKTIKIFGPGLVTGAADG